MIEMCIFRYIDSMVPGKQEVRDRNQKKRERQRRQGYGSRVAQSAHGAFVPVDISSQTTNVRDSTNDRTINTCLVDLNVLFVMSFLIRGREILPVWKNQQQEGAYIFNVAVMLPEFGTYRSGFLWKQIERGKAC